MKPKEFFGKLKEGHLLPLYYFYGDDEYLKDNAVKIVLTLLGEKINRSLNFEVFTGSTTSLASIIDNARTIPLFGKRKIILIKEAEKLSSSGQEQLLSFLENPSKKTIIILLSSPSPVRGEALKSSQKSLKKYDKYGLVIGLNHPYQNEIPDWIKYLVSIEGKAMDSSAIDLIHDLVGNNLQELSQEIEKLSLFIGERKEITQEDVKKVISGLRIDSVFEMIDHIGNRKHIEALVALSKLLKSGEQPLKILGLIARQFRMIMKARFLLDKGVSQEEIGHCLNIKKNFNYVWKKLYPQLPKFSDKKLEDCFQRMWEADGALKSRLPKKLVLEQLVIELCK